MKKTLLHSMLLYELRLSLRSKWLMSISVLFFFLAAIFYLYGITSVKADPSAAIYGAESGISIETGTVDPSIYGLKEIETKELAPNELLTSSYNRTISLLINLSLWLIPILCLIIGTTSIISDKESGRMDLYKTYQTPYILYLLSKLSALSFALIAATGFSFGLFGLLSAVLAGPTETSLLQTFLILNVLLILVFSAISLMIGSFCSTRMQGLAYSLFFWSFFVFIYEFVIFTLIEYIPYSYKLKGLFILILANPIESIRIWSISKLNAAYIFGPEYLILNEWSRSGELTLYLTLSLIIIIGLSVLLSNLLIKRRA